MAFSQKVKDEVARRSGGLCERILPNGKRCFGHATQYHHKELKGMGGRHGEAKVFSDSVANCLHTCTPCHDDRHLQGGWKGDGSG